MLKKLQTLWRIGKVLARAASKKTRIYGKGKYITGGLTGYSVVDTVFFNDAEEKSKNLLLFGKYLTDDEVEEQGLELGEFANEYADSLGIELYDKNGKLKAESVNQIAEAFNEEANNAEINGTSSTRWLDTVAETLDPYGLTTLADMSGLTTAFGRPATFEDTPRLRAEEALKTVRSKTLSKQLRDQRLSDAAKLYGDVGPEFIDAGLKPSPGDSSISPEKTRQMSDFKDAVRNEGLSVALSGASEKYPLIRNEILSQIRQETYLPETGDIDQEGARALLSNAGYTDAPDLYPTAPVSAKAPAAPAAPPPPPPPTVAEQAKAQAEGLGPMQRAQGGPSYGELLGNPNATRGQRYDALMSPFAGQQPGLTEEEVLNRIAPTRNMTPGQRMDYNDQNPPMGQPFNVATAGRGAAEGQPEPQSTQPQPQTVADAVRSAPETQINTSGFMTDGRNTMPTLGGKYVRGFLMPSDWQDFSADELAEANRTGDSPTAVRMQRHFANKQKQSADRGMEVFNRLFRPKTTATPAAPAAQPAAPVPAQAPAAPFTRSGVGASLPGLGPSTTPVNASTLGGPSGYAAARLPRGPEFKMTEAGRPPIKAPPTEYGFYGAVRPDFSPEPMSSFPVPQQDQPLQPELPQGPTQRGRGMKMRIPNPRGVNFQ